MWALVALAGALTWHMVDRDPQIKRQMNADNLRVLQEERERDRSAGAERDRVMNRALEGELEKGRAAAAAQSQMMTDTARKLGADMARLEAAIDQLSKKLGTTPAGCQCREPMPMPGAVVSDFAQTAVQMLVGLGYVLRQYGEGDD